MAISVIPICAADKKISGLLARYKALLAARSPFSASVSSRALRAETRAISDITNRELRKIRKSSMMISIYWLVILPKVTKLNRLLKKVPNNTPNIKQITAPPTMSKG